jgi:hypothetical protein
MDAAGLQLRQGRCIKMLTSAPIQGSVSRDGLEQAGWDPAAGRSEQGRLEPGWLVDLKVMDLSPLSHPEPKHEQASIYRCFLFYEECQEQGRVIRAAGAGWRRIARRMDRCGYNEGVAGVLWLLSSRCLPAAAGFRRRGGAVDVVDGLVQRFGEAGANSGSGDDRADLADPLPDHCS